MAVDVKRLIGFLLLAFVVLLVVALGGYYASKQNWIPLPPTDDAVVMATAAVVEYVHDGDTLFLEDGRKVRLLGINTPEIGDDRECYGEEATAALRALLPEGTEVLVASDIEPLDQYGRSLLFVYTDGGLNVNLEMIAKGAATVEMYEPNVLLRDQLYAAERAARDAGLGLWGVCRG